MYSGIETNTLTITNASYDMDQYQYQALIYMETFACGTLTSDPPVVLTVKKDTDGDGQADETDLDDDNDGILDTDEPGDADNDGIPNSLELDSDNDGCSDAKEAGFTDANGDGKVDGTGLNPNGTVSGSDGYQAAADENANATPDFLEAGPDSDNDGIADACDNNNDDLDGDGTVDANDMRQ